MRRRSPCLCPVRYIHIARSFMIRSTRPFGVPGSLNDGSADRFGIGAHAAAPTQVARSAFNVESHVLPPAARSASASMSLASTPSASRIGVPGAATVTLRDPDDVREYLAVTFIEPVVGVVVTAVRGSSDQFKPFVPSES